MRGDLEKIRKVFLDKLKTLSVIEDVLSNELQQNRDVSWGVSVVKEVGVYFNKLRDLDKEQNEIEWLKSSNNDTEILTLANKIQGSMNNVKKLLSVFSMKLQGGQEIVKSEIKELVKAKKINGYKSVFVK